MVPDLGWAYVAPPMRQIRPQLLILHSHAGLRERVAALWGADYAERMMPIASVAAPIGAPQVSQ